MDCKIHPSMSTSACSIRSLSREWWARQASLLPQVIHNGKAALSIWLCPGPWEEGLTDLLDMVHTSASVLQSLEVSNHQHRPLALKINQDYKMKRGSKHNPVYCQYKQGCLLEQCSHLLLSVPFYTLGYCYAFWHLWCCSEEARAFAFKYQMLQKAGLN